MVLEGNILRIVACSHETDTCRSLPKHSDRVPFTNQQGKRPCQDEMTPIFKQRKTVPRINPRLRPPGPAWPGQRATVRGLRVVVARQAKTKGSPTKSHLPQLTLRKNSGFGACSSGDPDLGLWFFKAPLGAARRLPRFRLVPLPQATRLLPDLRGSSARVALGPATSESL